MLNTKIIVKHMSLILNFKIMVLFLFRRLSSLSFFLSSFRSDILSKIRASFRVGSLMKASLPKTILP